jgi:hypothetical protein
LLGANRKPLIDDCGDAYRRLAIAKRESFPRHGFDRQRIGQETTGFAHDCIAACPHKSAVAGRDSFRTLGLLPKDE